MMTEPQLPPQPCAPLERSFLIPTTAVGHDARLRLSALLGLMQEVASEHAERLGVGFDALRELRQAFVLSRLDIRFEGPLPAWGETLSLRTWPRGADRLLALRDFIGTREDGSVALRASSGWLAVNIDTHRPQRIEPMLERINPLPELAMPGEDVPRRLAWADALPKVDERLARASDLDPNHHVNNTRYGDFVGDALATLHGLQARPLRVSINFLAELRFGERIEIAAHDVADGRLRVQGQGARRCFCAELEWTGGDV